MDGGEIMSKRIIIGFAALLIAAVLLLPRQTDDVEIAPAGEALEGRSLDRVDRPEITLDPSNVPRDLRDLIPFAEEWGIGDDVIRSDVEESATEQEKEQFRTALTGRTDRVTEWLDSFGTESMSDEAGTFMFMLVALDEMGIWPDE